MSAAILVDGQEDSDIASVEGSYRYKALFAVEKQFRNIRSDAVFTRALSGDSVDTRFHYC